MSEDFTESVIAFLPNLRRYAMSLCRNSSLADDLVQIACEKAFTNEGQYQTGTRLDAWLFRILRNSWLDQLRRRKTQGTEVEIDEEIISVTVDGAGIAEDRLMLQQTMNVIMDLPEQQREIMLLVCVEGMSYKEASELLDVPIGTVMSRLARARTEVAKGVGIK
ncbi:MAG: RNA polymerase sigma factor [Rhizobiaceae bacterium]